MLAVCGSTEPWNDLKKESDAGSVWQYRALERPEEGKRRKAMLGVCGSTEPWNDLKKECVAVQSPGS